MQHNSSGLPEVAGSRRLHELAHDYYTGELNYESYRRARTQLLDRITAVTGDDDCTRSATRQANKPGVAGSLLSHKSERSWYLRGTVWILIVVLSAITLMAYRHLNG